MIKPWKVKGKVNKREKGDERKVKENTKILLEN
jgi:hypothetical protein